MQLVSSPLVTASVALVGAGVVAVTPFFGSAADITGLTVDLGGLLSGGGSPFDSLGLEPKHRIGRS